MTTIITPSGASGAPSAGPIGGGGLAAILAKTGRFPAVSLIVKPLEGAGGFITLAQDVSGQPLVRFVGYTFQSSIIVPVDTFSFTFSAPDASPVTDTINEGDIVVLEGNGVELSTGIIDQVEIEVDSDGGEKVTLTGRDLMSQLEDQDAISIDSSPIWVEKTTVLGGVQQLCKDTRITTVNLAGATPSSTYLLATEPGESKLAALQRFLEPLNCVAWMAPNGDLNVGKPDMAQDATGTFIVSRENRVSNCLSMRATRASTTVPNIIVPIWAGQETTVNRVSKEQALTNKAAGPSRLLKLGHRVPKTVVVSTPQATDAQGVSTVNAFTAGGGNILQAYAKREMARKNVSEIGVQVAVAGHFADDGSPFAIDTVYRITSDRLDIDENMYLYQVEYTLDESGGQRSNLYFCRLGCIVADNAAPGATS